MKCLVNQSDGDRDRESGKDNGNINGGDGVDGIESNGQNSDGEVHNNENGNTIYADDADTPRTRRINREDDNSVKKQLLKRIRTAAVVTIKIAVIAMGTIEIIITNIIIIITQHR